MTPDVQTLIWFFPIAFMFHDFEEIILGAPWLARNAAEIKGRVSGRVPAFLSEQIGAVLSKSTEALTLPISLIFTLAFLSSFVAVQYRSYGFFLLASSSFFLHGFMHVGQAVLLRRYIPAVISSVLVVIPYGLVLFGRLIGEGMVDVRGVLVSFALAVVLTIPFILVMHKIGDVLYRLAVRVLIR